MLGSAERTAHAVVEEYRTADDGTEEDPKRVERLREVEPARGMIGRPEHADIGVRRRLEKAQTGREYEHRRDEERETFHLRRRHEQERADRRHDQAGDQTEFIAACVHHAACREA